MPTRSAAQERAFAKMEYDAYLATCPSRQLLDGISDKWVALVLAGLAEEGKMRYSALARRLAGVSQKMLTQTLRALERDGLVSRSVTPTVPVTVEYELTVLGASLQGLMVQLKHWAEEHMDEVRAHRETYDAASGSRSSQAS
jgi:DNA-binding HxlR family transcriptional regulator